MKCEKCGAEIDEDESRTIYGTAEVTGVTSIREFRRTGVAWDAGNSDEEYIFCPSCGERIYYFKE